MFLWRDQTNVFQYYLGFNAVDYRQVICKGRWRAEKEQHQSERASTQNNSQRHKPPYPLSLELIQETMSGFTTFYSVSLRRQCFLFFLKGQKRVGTVFPQTTFPCPICTCIIVGLCHKSSSTRPSQKISQWARSLQFRDILHGVIEQLININYYGMFPVTTETRRATFICRYVRHVTLYSRVNHWTRSLTCLTTWWWWQRHPLV